MNKGSESLTDFFRKQPIFTSEELSAFLDARGTVNPRTRESLVRYHRAQGAILQIRRGLYCSVPPGIVPQQCPVDSYLLASKLAPDSVLAYHTALEAHGRSYSVQQRLVYVSLKHPAGSTFKFRGITYQSVSPPKQLGKNQPEVQSLDRVGQKIRLTTLERTLVDVLDRPRLSGGWEEIWRSLETIPYLELDRVVQYALLLRKSTTIARVGFYLSQHRDSLLVEEDHLKPLRDHRPRSPKYFTSNPTRLGRLVHEWNLIVPEAVLTKSWEEPT
jgi:predicted transcriptional regulator of viral defense system